MDDCVKGDGVEAGERFGGVDDDVEGVAVRSNGIAEDARWSRHWEKGLVEYASAAIVMVPYALKVFPQTSYQHVSFHSFSLAGQALTYDDPLCTCKKTQQGYTDII